MNSFQGRRKAPSYLFDSLIGCMVVLNTIGQMAATREVSIFIVCTSPWHTSLERYFNGSHLSACYCDSQNNRAFGITILDRQDGIDLASHAQFDFQI